MKRYGAEGGTRTPTSYLTRPSNVRVYQFRHFGSYGQGCQRFKVRAGYFLVGAFDGCVAVAGDAEGADDASGVTCAVATGDGEGSGCCSGTPDCKTERVPVIIGSDNTNANNMKPAAAPIVILDKSVCVPLGPNAVLETELENSAPASDLPG